MNTQFEKYGALAMLLGGIAYYFTTISYLFSKLAQDYSLTLM